MELLSPDSTLSPHVAASSSQSKPNPQGAVASRQKSCDNCRDRKKRCDREQPCDRCDKLGLKCIFTKRPRSKHGRMPMHPAVDRPSRLPPRAARLKAAAAVIDESRSLSKESASTASPTQCTAVATKDHAFEPEARLKQASEPIESIIVQAPNADPATVLPKRAPSMDLGTITPLSPRVLLKEPPNLTILQTSNGSAFTSSRISPQYASGGSALANDLSLHFNGGSNFNDQVALASATQNEVNQIVSTHNSSFFSSFGQPFLPSSQILPRQLPPQQNQRPPSMLQHAFQNYNTPSLSAQNQIFNSLQQSNAYLNNSVSSGTQFVFPATGLTLPGNTQMPWQQGSVPAPFQLQSSSSMPLLNFGSNVGYSGIYNSSFFFGDDKKAGK